MQLRQDTGAFFASFFPARRAPIFSFRTRSGANLVVVDEVVRALTGWQSRRRTCGKSINRDRPERPSSSSSSSSTIGMPYPDPVTSRAYSRCSYHARFLTTVDNDVRYNDLRSERPLARWKIPRAEIPLLSRAHRHALFTNPPPPGQCEECIDFLSDATENNRVGVSISVIRARPRGGPITSDIDPLGIDCK